MTDLERKLMELDKSTLPAPKDVEFTYLPDGLSWVLWMQCYRPRYYNLGYRGDERAAADTYRYELEDGKLVGIYGDPKSK